MQQGKSGVSLTQIFQSCSEPHPDPVQSVSAVLSLRNYIFAKEIFIFAMNNAFVASRRHGPRYLSCKRGAYKSLARLTSRCILFDGENISFDASLVIYVNSTK